MKHLKKKSVIIMASVFLLVAGLIVTTIFLVNNSDTSEKLNATIINVSTKRQQMSKYIIRWDSLTKTHEKAASNENVKCSIEVNGETYEYENFEEGWIEATTTYKNKGDLVFTFYDDWVADPNGNFGSDKGTKGTSFVNGNSSLLIKNWSKCITIDFNGYKIDRNIQNESLSYGSVIKVDEGNKIYFKNGCITGGATSDDGGGVLIYGKPQVYFENMTITGNFAGSRGGGIFVGTHVLDVFLNNTKIEGNYAEKYGGGVYTDYSSHAATSRFNLKNVVTIQNNIGLDYRNNLTLCAKKNDSDCPYIYEVDIAEGSSIYISLSCKDSKARAALQDHSGYDGDCDQYFHVDDPECVLKSTWFGRSTIPGLGSMQWPGLIIYKK